MDDIEDDGFITIHPKDLSEIQKDVRLLSLKAQGIVVDGIAKHGSPQDRGSADAYYHRKYDPHWWPEGTGKGVRIEQQDMTEDQIAQYRYGYDNEEDRKDYG